jgi:hypothetical protein
MKMNTEENEYQKAKKRVKEMRGFYTHLVVYALVNLLLFLINITTSPGLATQRQQSAYREQGHQDDRHSSCHRK